MSSLAPLSSYMKLGQGFNSYTQEVCIEDAVLITRRIPPPPVISRAATRLLDHGDLTDGHRAISPVSFHDTTTQGSSLPALEPAMRSLVPAKAPPPARNLSQIVTYSSRSVSNMADIVDALNISASASIKYGTVKGSGSASFVNENKVNSSDINYVVTVKVSNAMDTFPDEMEFNPLEGLDPRNFTDIFGDCFISGFLEGGEFSAIISIKVDDKSKLSEVKAAAEVSLAIAAAPGLSVGASTSTDKKNSNVWNDTETTISVNWSGGGELKDPATKWDLPTVIDVASRFPHLVETSSQKTSAILTKYTSLRSYAIENNRLLASGGKEAGYFIRNYGLCQLYTMDLFSAYMAYKGIWTKISEMMKHIDRYQERERTKEVPNPVELSSKGLNEARLLARKQLTLITAENARLTTEPELADIDEHGNQRPLPFMNPGELSMRLPFRVTFVSIRDQVDPSKNNALLTAEEIGAVGVIARRPDQHLSPLSGDSSTHSTSWLQRGKTSLFCTADINQDPKQLDNLVKLRFHAHQHHHGDIFADLQHHSKSSEGFLSAIGFSVSKDANTKPRADSTHHQVGRPNDNPQYWSRLADLSFSKVANVMVEYLPGSGKISSIVLQDPKKNEITSWKQHGQAKITRPAGLQTDQQSPPEPREGWRLAGFWGHSDAIVITRIGTIWKRYDTGSVATSLGTSIVDVGYDGALPTIVE